jgi:lipopolysaccharide biosynthesis regulator YciM
MDYTTIQLDKKLTDELKKVREHPRETYNETIQKLVKVYKSMKQRNQYDEFLHRIQQPKMKELWDNESDEEWNNA